MAYRPLLSPFPVITSGDLSQATVTSLPTILSNLSMVSYSYTWSGTSPVGTISVEGSNDYALNADGTVKNAGTWNTLTLNYGGTAVSSIPLSGSPGSALIDIELTAIFAIRTKYTRTSGSGTLDCLINGKVS